jgi:hypothetical protein
MSDVRGDLGGLLHVDIFAHNKSGFACRIDARGI